MVILVIIVVIMVVVMGDCGIRVDGTGSNAMVTVTDMLVLV